MSQDEQAERPRRWRVGRKVAIHVYEVLDPEGQASDDDPVVAMFMRPEDAAAAVEAFNAAERERS